MPLAPIALTCGEPAGIGLELAEKAWAALRLDLPFFLLADPDHLSGDTPISVIQDPAEALDVMPNALPVLPHPFFGRCIPGTPDPENAEGVVEVISRGADLAQSGAASALCTSPIHKKALKDGAEFPYPGHTEYLAYLGNVDNVVMMIASDALRVVPATIHIPISEVPATLTTDGLYETIRITADGLRTQFGIAAPRLAVAGLNPHAGEGGAMGHEDATVIAPAIARAQADGLDVTGPWPADTMFHASARAKYDAAICAYHDQALIPAKTLAFDEGVNVTLGLPFIRTSPDHGTAFDIAGQGIANPSSTIHALKLAHQMAKSR
ncbi:4-hydroxythreonine-4-phosphate dehydrogenase PdxA [Shimia abyssi]|uniref:4-hydroxythreonine-4-phosphate dehydrogenase n=1 Tax=Shimia abyssi TaxID=1662395 RepID=A0A2P8FGC0_9RHOB|nr:4-hydroxythreonine-4-phosphate dehydrogenase PdxA [Shimia abyssi]PSL20744.1 4-hydroxythreonine-4-phosphate dehydrogenase [Shimia abyssi]